MNEQNEKEYVQDSGEIKSKSPKKIRVFVLIICLIISLMIWIYAQNADDPLNENIMNVTYTCNDDGYDCIGSIQSIEVYGVQSIIYKYNNTPISVSVDINNGDKQTIKIELPDGIHFKDKDNVYSVVTIQKKVQQ